MSAKKTARKKTKKKVLRKKKTGRITGTFSPPPMPSVDSTVKEKIRKDVEKEIRSQLGFSTTITLPADVIKAINAASDSAINKVASSNLNRIASSVASSNMQSSVNFKTSIKDKLKVGLDGLQGMTTNADYAKMLTESAKMMKAKFDALVAAGFNDDQAFSLVEAEVYAKGATRKRG